ncbi:TPA: hypothetical protein ACX6PJ_001215 [Photobacterium damselae]
MNKIVGSTFENARITLDNMSYESCTFNKCVVEFSGVGETKLISCNFNDCQWVFVGPAESTLGFLQAMYHDFGTYGREMIEATFEKIRTDPKTSK